MARSVEMLGRRTYAEIGQHRRKRALLVDRRETAQKGPFLGKHSVEATAALRCA